MVPTIDHPQGDDEARTPDIRPRATIEMTTGFTKHPLLH
jgi:hypothetical protein